MQLTHESPPDTNSFFWSVAMKLLLSLLFSVALVGFSLLGGPAIAQSPADGKNQTGDRWVSHQMHQPPPDVVEKNKLSKDRVDEIRQLYLQAKKEQEEASKAGVKAAK